MSLNEPYDYDRIRLLVKVARKTGKIRLDKSPKQTVLLYNMKQVNYLFVVKIRLFNRNSQSYNDLDIPARFRKYERYRY